MTQNKYAKREIGRNVGMFVCGYLGSVAVSSSLDFLKDNSFFITAGLMGGFVITAIIGIWYQTKWSLKSSSETNDLKKRIENLENQITNSSNKS